MIAMSYASFSGIISGMCLLFAKSGVELLVLTIGGKNQFWRWQAWVLVAGLVVCALLRLWYMHKSLILANPMLICPLAFCFYNLSSILNGLVYFDQFSLLPVSHLLLVLLGIGVLLAGVWIVSFPPGGAIGVDVGPWNEDENAVDLTSELDTQEVYEDEPLPMVTQPPQRTGSPDGIGLGLARSSSQEPRRGHLQGGSLRVQNQVQDSLTKTFHGRSQTESALPPKRYQPQAPMVPPWERPSATVATATPPPRRPRATSTMGPTATVPLPRQHFNGYGFPSPPGAAPGTLAGFSIGLSPMSPGFSLVPRERSRRRRVSGLSGLDVENGGTGKIRAEGLMRRSVSDGNVHAIERHGDEEDEGEESALLNGADDEIERGRRGSPRTGEIPPHPARPAKSRWKWVRNILSFKR